MSHGKMVYLLCSFITLVSFSIFPQSIASSLGLYQKTFETDITGISGTSSSGVTFYPGTGTLYVVDDANTTVYEISTTGSLIRSITLSGFDDTEGIAYQSGMFFFIVEERLANVLRVQLPQSGSGPVSWDSCAVLSIADDWGNSGLEGVSYCASTNTVYAVKEIDPPRLYRITLDSNDNPANFFENDPFNIEGISGDAADIYALSDGNFLILSQEENKLIGYSDTGEILSELSLGMTKPEGITIDPNDSTIYVVGEPRELFVFENQGTFTLPFSGISLNSIFFNLHVLNNKSIILYYRLSSAAHVQIEMFSAQGKRIKTLVNETVAYGNHQCILNAQSLPAGLYLFVFNVASYKKVIREILF